MLQMSQTSNERLHENLADWDSISGQFPSSWYDPHAIFYSALTLQFRHLHIP
ncbi:hypothetical protein BU26DRAFT_516236 [Trematosphaeria pertusa]|uniref:Uncharacterized protein n=1 Tax=Trematosphaeria pertusa TaxID=390896 RepID=A0A6A6IU92_9PLEO|nr:uncharacterized protein BU26DRAFT_516236 [Trematosphaeria pertusa]KAF2253986.1 hypothetical protein BU26DRAFT_516236 [Trematosphaeria pertusa]